MVPVLYVIIQQIWRYHMEIGFLILFFVAPGLLVNAIAGQRSILNNRKERKATIYEQLFSSVANSIVITGLSFFFLKTFHHVLGVPFPSKVSDVLALLDDIDILCAYVCVALVTSLIWEYVFSHCIKKLWFRFKNKKYEKKHHVRLTNESGFTVLESFLLDLDQTGDETREAGDEKPPLIVSIYKEGVYMTSGILYSWNVGEEDPLEFELVRTMDVEKIIEDDKNRPHSEKWLQDVDNEIFLAKDGILIKSYSPGKALKHWDEITF